VYNKSNIGDIEITFVKEGESFALALIMYTFGVDRYRNRKQMFFKLVF